MDLFFVCCYGYQLTNLGYLFSLRVLECVLDLPGKTQRKDIEIISKVGPLEGTYPNVVHCKEGEGGGLEMTLKPSQTQVFWHSRNSKCTAMFSVKH